PLSLTTLGKQHTSLRKIRNPRNRSSEIANHQLQMLFFSKLLESYEARQVLPKTCQAKFELSLEIGMSLAEMCCPTQKQVLIWYETTAT
ncbi:MAG: hypothetical protein WBP42_13050, partial [Candidatus Zixiibacteriota bacterium]